LLSWDQALHEILNRPSKQQLAGLTQCSGMPLKKVTLDPAGTDEFSLTCPSQPPTDM
jgi:hypothetical protein